MSSNALTYKTLTVYTLLIIPMVLYANKKNTIPSIYEAYQQYITGNFKSSYFMYKAVYKNNTKNKDVVYGIIGSLIGLSKYSNAAKWSKKLYGIENDSLYYLENIYLNALCGNRKKTTRLYSNYLKSFALSDDSKRKNANMVINSFLSTGESIDAKLFLRKNKYQFTNDEYRDLYTLINDKIKSNNGSFANISFSPIVYENKVNVDDMDNSQYFYRQSATYYFSAYAGFNFNKHNKISISESNFKAKIIDRKISTGIKYTDTLYASLGEYPDTSDTFFSVSLDSSDTAFVTYKEFNPAKNNVDTVVTENLDNKNNFQNRLGISYHITAPYEKNISIGFGGYYNYKTNVVGAQKGSSVWFMTAHSLPSTDIVFNWYGTTSDELSFFQSTLDIYQFLLGRKIVIKISPSYIWKIKGNYDIPGVQISSDFSLSFYSKHIATTGMFSIGKKSFQLSEQGREQLSIIDQHKYTALISIEIMPNKKIAIYGLGIFQQFKNYYRYIIQGGLNVSIF